MNTQTTKEVDFVRDVRERIAKVVVGQQSVVDRLLISLFTGGHLLLEGVPGIGKTLLVMAMARAVDLSFRRVQFTIDMLPSDIIGSEILDQKTGTFSTNKGPVFTNLLLADEINRASPKVQSALLESMQERKVTIGNETHVLPAPFLVIATQNPIEQSGTFDLPEAQLDRFMLCHRLKFPTAEEEECIVKCYDDSIQFPRGNFSLMPRMDNGLSAFGPSNRYGFVSPLPISSRIWVAPRQC